MHKGTPLSEAVSDFVQRKWGAEEEDELSGLEAAYQQEIHEGEEAATTKGKTGEAEKCRRVPAFGCESAIVPLSGLQQVGDDISIHGRKEG